MVVNMRPGSFPLRRKLALSALWSAKYAFGMRAQCMRGAAGADVLGTRRRAVSGVSGAVCAGEKVVKAKSPIVGFSTR